MILLTIDKSTTTSVYRQICDQIISLIDEGVLAPGDRLPTTRGLAETLAIHRSTVLTAYDELRALGYLESSSGSYTRVRGRLRLPTIERSSRLAPAASIIDWHQEGVRLSEVEDPLPAGVIDFDTLAADPSLAPDADLRRCLKQVLVWKKAEALQYTGPAGYGPLRETVAHRLRTHGMAVSPDDILITNGAQQALDLILRWRVQPGDPVVVEAPTYSMAHTLLRLHGARVVEVPMTTEGMDLAVLKKVLAGIRPKLVYSMPNFHNPMGITTDQAHREKLLGLCEAARVPLVEDGFEEEMKYFGKAVLPIKSMDTGGIVFYVGTFSKVVFSGLRVGWIAAPQGTIPNLAHIQHASCLSVNTLAQAALQQFCSGGRFEAYLRRVHKIYRRRLQTMLRGLDQHLPPGVTWTRPVGGYTLWLTLPACKGEEAALCEAFRKAGVATGPGRRFFAEKRKTSHFRLSIACVKEEDIIEGCRRLGRVLSEDPLEWKNV